MIIVYIWWVSLVLGGLAGCLWMWEALGGKWLQVARVPVRLHRPVWQWDRGSSGSFGFGAPRPPPRRAGSRWSPLRYHLLQGKRKRE